MTGTTLKSNSRIAIANRGEAAVRFIRAVNEFNNIYGTKLSVIVFYEDVEKDALFVKQADYAYPFSGFSKAKESVAVCGYMDRALMLEAIQETKCDALWPGWGFLSEDAEFTQMLEDRAITFLGPNAYSMSLLGDKIAAKELADKSNVPTLAWSEGNINSLEEAKQISEKIGYPVIIKASQAGGGRGIRFVRTEAELEAMYKSAVDETVRITGNNIVFIEQLVEEGRHLEVQILADKHGNVSAFGVRDCSVQRKNQKIIEETPPPGISDKIVTEMQEAAIRLIKEAKYHGAGTVEFLYDVKKEAFYFMEVNTRLQVEHPITEQLYGFDLVKGQIKVAMGEEVKGNFYPRGAVIEVRLNAEDPDRDFTPAPGDIKLFKIPTGPGIRVDSGVEEGSSIPTQFDSMIAKVIAYAPSRKETIGSLRRALSELKIKIEGGTTNRAFLLELLKSEEIQSGPVTTHFVADFIEKNQEIITRNNWDIALVSCAIEQYYERYNDELINFKQQLRFLGTPNNINISNGYEIHLSLKGVSYNLLVKAIKDSHFHIEVNNTILAVKYVRKNNESTLYIDDERYFISIVSRGDVLQCEVNGTPYFLELESGGYVKSPSPAMVLSLSTFAGQEVKKGDLLLTLEAMKMEMLVSAPESGVVKSINVREGEQVNAGQPLVHIDTSDQEKDQDVEEQTPISFERFQSKNARVKWQMLENEFLAVFLGYDYTKKPSALLKNMMELSYEDKTFTIELTKTLYSALDIYCSVEELFHSEQVKGEGFARAENYQEHLMHYFKRSIDREKGLPEKFITAMKRVMKWYPLESLTEEEKQNRALFRIFRSHFNLQEKEGLLQSVLLELEGAVSRESLAENTADLLDEIIQLTQARNSSLSDASIYARYNLVDKIKLEELKKEQKSKVKELLELILKTDNSIDVKAKLRQEIINAGSHIVPYILNILYKQDREGRNLALELLAERFNRDREIQSGEFVPFGPFETYCLKSIFQEKTYETLVVVVRQENYQEILTKLSQSDITKNREVIVFYTGIYSEDIISFFMRLPIKAAWISLGFVTSKVEYYNFYSIETGLQKDTTKKQFNPLEYRELRIARLENFDLRIHYASELVYLVSAIAKENPKDERLFALVEVPETLVELDEDNTIHRMIAFECALTEAIQAMRNVQAKRKRRSFWNRIIIHIRSLLQTNLKQIKNYAATLSARTIDLGIEKVVVYSRREGKEEKTTHEVELLFENISGDQFTLRGRTPKEDKLRTMDKYVAKVVKSRQRKTVYPYEIVRMITGAGFPGKEKFPRGHFEEFDIRVNENGKREAISVKGRPYGENTGNIVFGIITNYVKIHSGLRRVLILSDPTTDMGALAEEECSRINAAIDLATKENLPIEWIPISAGARIDMDSGTENLDWTACTLRKIIEFTQNGGEINIIVSGINVGAQSYWNSEATMLMHTKGLLIMTTEASMLLTGKKALDFSGSVSAENNVGIGGVEKIMGPNGQAQVWVKDLNAAYWALFKHYSYTYVESDKTFPSRITTEDHFNRDITAYPYKDTMNVDFTKVGDIFSKEFNPDRKKPFDIRQVMYSVIDNDCGFFERWHLLKDAETSVVWETRIGGVATGLLGIESRPLTRLGSIPNDGPDAWSGGTLFPQSSKKIARAINAFSAKIPVVILANLSGFDGSPESLRKCQLEFGAEIGRAVVNFQGPIIFVVIARYHGGAYVVFSKTLNPNLKAVALENTYASVIGGAPAAAVVFPRIVKKNTLSDPQIVEAQKKLGKDPHFTKKDFDEIMKEVYSKKQTALGQHFDQIHCVERAKKVGSIDDIISPAKLRPFLIKSLEEGMVKYLNDKKKMILLPK